MNRFWLGFVLFALVVLVASRSPCKRWSRGTYWCPDICDASKHFGIHTIYISNNLVNLTCIWDLPHVKVNIAFIKFFPIYFYFERDSYKVLQFIFLNKTS